jgi:PAS domain-containing protein
LRSPQPMDSGAVRFSRSKGPGVSEVVGRSGHASAAPLRSAHKVRTGISEGRVIIRLFRGRLPPARSRGLLERLRAFPTGPDRPAGLVSFTYGFRHERDSLAFLAISSWRDFADISRSGRRVDRDLVEPHLESESGHPGVEHYELAGDAVGLPLLDGAVLGLLWGRVAPNAEARAHEMVRAVEADVARAGVLALYTGRRVIEAQSEILVAALWRHRQALHAFATGRPGGTLNPEFLKLLTEWRFETFDCLGLDRLLVPPSGPAVLVADDDGRYIDASPGVEALLGVPGELILHGQIEDITPPERRREVRTAWQSFLEAGHQEGVFELAQPDGSRLNVRFRAQANCPKPGLHASVLSLPDDASLDGLSIDAIVGDALQFADGRRAAPVASRIS